MTRLSWLAAPTLLTTTSIAFAQQAPASQLESGGLRPPEAVDSSSPDVPPGSEQAETEEQLERADREDAGRGLEWVWLNAEIGAQHLGLQTFQANDLVDPTLVKTTQTGLTYGAGLGIRLLVFTIGARFRMGSFDDWQLWTLDAEGGLHIPIGRVEPYLTLGLGYASLGSFSATSPASSKADVKGFNGRLGFGVDVYVSNTFTIGGNLTGDVLFLSRPEVEGAASSGGSAMEARIYAQDGSSIGAGATLTAVAGLHF
jgi:hypothetical protein